MHMMVALVRVFLLGLVSSNWITFAFSLVIQSLPQGRRLSFGHHDRSMGEFKAYCDRNIMCSSSATRLFSSSSSSHEERDEKVDHPQNDDIDKSPTDWSSAWFPVAFEQFTDKVNPTSHNLLGAPIAVWYDDKQEKWNAVLDKCPHRLVPLSEGRITTNGDIECPYHGFTFEGTTGTCTRIPQQKYDEQGGGNKKKVELPIKSCATALPCQIQQGILWVHTSPLYYSMDHPNHAIKMDSSLLSEELERYKVDAIDQPGVVYSDYFRDLPMEWSTLAENVLDPSHLPFTHHKTISSRDKATPVPIKLTGSITAQGFHADRLTKTPGSLEFRAPHLVYSRTSRPNSFTDWNVVYAIPTLPGRCRLLVRVVFQVSKMKPPLKWIFGIAFRQPASWLHLSNHKILEDDNIFLHHQGHNYRSAFVHKNSTFQDETYLPTSADMGVIAFQRWAQEHFVEQWSPHTPLGAFLERDKVLRRDDLIERQYSHTESCQSCLQLRSMLERVQPILEIGWILCAIWAFRSTGSSISGKRAHVIISRVIAGAGASLMYWLKLKTSKMKRNMNKGVWPPPRNV